MSDHEREEMQRWMVLTAKETVAATGDKLEEHTENLIQQHIKSCELRAPVESLIRFQRWAAGVAAALVVLAIAAVVGWLLVTYQSQGAHAAQGTPTTQPARVP